MESRRLILGVDGGGTKTRIAVSDGREMLRIVTGGPTNFQVVGLEKAIENLREVLQEATEGFEGIDFAFFGMAGADTEMDKEMVKRVIEGAWSGRYELSDDGLIALKAAFPKGPGVVVTCGTGSISYSTDGKKHHRIGGYSTFFGERLGSFYVASLVYSAAIRGKDGRGEKTVMLDMIEDLAKAPVENLTVYTHIKDEPPFDLVKGAIKVLIEACKMEDKVARGIVKEIASEVVRIVRAHERAMKMEFRKVALMGTCFRVMRDVLKDVLLEIDDREYFIPDRDPVAGAILMACERIGMECGGMVP